MISPSQPVGLRCPSGLHRWCCSHLVPSTSCRMYWYKGFLVIHDQRQLLRMQLPNLQSVIPRGCTRMTPDYLLGDLCLVELRPILVLLQIEHHCPYHSLPTVSSVHLVLRDVTSHQCWCLGRILHRPEPFDSNVFVCCVAFDLVLTCLTQFHLRRRVFVSL